MKYPKLYNGVRLLGDGPCLQNVERIDLGALPMIQHMARTGLRVDLDHFAKLHTTLVQDMDKISEDVYTMTGYRVNLNSGDQVSDLLFKKMGLKQARTKMTKTRDRESVEDEVLVAIQHDHPVVPKVLDFKELSKLKGTYVDPIPKLAIRVSLGVWKLLPNLNTTRVPSGRMSAKKPNLLAMPTRTERGREIRKGFITDPGWVYLSVDESQIEVRLAAHCSIDPALVRNYENDEDIYSDFAIKAFKLADTRYQNDAGEWKYPSVHKMDQRYPAKTCILASIYDVSAGGLLEQMPIICGNCHLEASKHTCGKFKSLWTESKCQDLINSFYMSYPGVMQDRLKNHAIARKLGYIYDMWGRILHVAAVRSVHPWVVSAALREVGNFPYQSGAQGTIKLTMAELWDTLVSCKLLDVAKPLLQVHDELLFEVREDMAEEIGELTKHFFEHCAPLNVPIKAGVAIADNWGSLEK